MQTLTKHKLNFNVAFSETELLHGLYIVVQHANRIPPHIGMIIDNKYHSLSIKGQDKNVELKALLKNIEQRKIPSLFIKIKSSPDSNNRYLRENFINAIERYPKVDIGIATCLSPIKLFFEEMYHLPMKDVHFLYELIPVLDSQNLILNASSLFLNEQTFELPLYSKDDINQGITLANNEIAEIKKRNEN